MARWGMVIDLFKCIGCYGCQASCKAEHATPPGVTLARVEIEEVGTYPSVSRIILPLLCMQCAPYFGEQGLTPFEEVGYAKRKTGVVVKCDYCRERIDAGLAKGLKPGVDREATPACVYNCMAKARMFGDMDDPSSEVAQLVASGLAFQLNPEHGTNPTTHYLPASRMVVIAEPPNVTIKSESAERAAQPAGKE
jgi:Fe-S-cluster-containing dehydrogenase component